MVPPEYQIIVANPYEKEKDVLSTIDLIQKLPNPYFLQPFALVFFPGTQLFYKARNDGIIKSKKDTCYDLHYMAYEENLMKKFKKLDTIYLNLILILMRGRVTLSRYGRLPKPLLKLLLNKMIIKFFNKLQFLTKLLIRFYISLKDFNRTS